MGSIDSAYRLARERYSELAVDVDSTLGVLLDTPISIHCWQGDDVTGFENIEKGVSGGGIQATGNYPGKARDIGELREDLEQVQRFVPGRHRISLHAMYGDFGDEVVDRNGIEFRHFESWVEWAKENNVGLDFNATMFGHRNADSGFTLSSKDPDVREFWVEHVKRCRGICAEIGKRMGTPCVHNLWVPDGMKDTTVDQSGYRELLKESLDEIYSVEYSPDHLLDSVESKLFGLGSESFVVGSHDFYLGYAVSRGLMPCLDTGHYHPMESVADKISAIMPFVSRIMLHVSRGVRWDSDHVVVLNDEAKDLFHEIVRGGYLNRVHIGLDYFDASINRVGAWVTGIRATQKALLYALLEPVEQLKGYETEGDYFERMALLEELKSMPWGAIWDNYCDKNSVPNGIELREKVKEYENKTHTTRS
ncbi:L-rhamnose isomerase [Candidatus Bathyarchaeota archaeon]|jgi:L-rhamnose isomerase|nr:L-rhamnose isomerase [Candidatus Bathyarchaeota archaeon]MBT4423473.1 L-rhamnose isomerase [Candidatus Bathyarchaeota archaeon]MBT7186346.1 L-rhamnose isomerase [Candidatus Bathyarchaeota archaeon]